MDTKAIVEILSRKLDCSKSDIVRLMDSLSVVMSKRCEDFDSVALPGFGTFEPVKQMERVVTDEATGSRTLMPPAITVQFKPSALLRQKIKKTRIASDE